jgi:hypothetical protein
MSTAPAWHHIAENTSSIPIAVFGYYFITTSGIPWLNEKRPSVGVKKPE